MWRALLPSYNRDTQTDRQTQVSDTGTHRQTAHAKGPSHSPSTIRQENTHICMYVCMYVCMHYNYMYVTMNGKLNVYKWMNLRKLCEEDWLYVHLCMYVCMYVCKYVCMAIGTIYVCTYVCMYVCTLYVYKCPCVVCKCIYWCRCKKKSQFERLNVCRYVCMYE